jgi:hypothetical protein
MFMVYAIFTPKIPLMMVEMFCRGHDCVFLVLQTWWYYMQGLCIGVLMNLHY